MADVPAWQVGLAIALAIAGVLVPLIGPTVRRLRRSFHVRVGEQTVTLEPHQGSKHITDLLRAAEEEDRREHGAAL